MKIKLEIIIPLILLFILLYSRFVGLNWGLPYPMHPDERNMAVAITQLSCKTLSPEDCFNPHFFAYGQFPLYLAYIISFVTSYILPNIGKFEHATMALRFISAISSVFTVYVLIKSLALLTKESKWSQYLLYLIAVFVPAFIQFAHFGTTESLLMMFYSILLYLSLLLLKQKIKFNSFALVSGVVFGVALGTKVSAAFFGAIPFLAICIYAIRKPTKESYINIFIGLINLAFSTFIIFFLTSPYNFLAWEEFLGSMNYESDVGFGRYKAFYTRQFEGAVPFLFQFIRIFPYSLGWPVVILFLSGFILLPYNKLNNFLRTQFLIFIIPNFLIYAKWSRFITPVFPLMVLVAILMADQILLVLRTVIKNKAVQVIVPLVIVMCTVIPGVAYLSIYINPDVRFEASKWVYTHMQNNSYILSETANVVDIPVPNYITPPILTQDKQYQYISFNFYDMHLVPRLQPELEDHISRADFILIPSRRVFANHSCYIANPNGNFNIENSQLGYEKDRCVRLRNEYTEVYSYYDRLFTGNLPFEKVAEFTSYPKISIFGKTLIEFPDEQAEETWTVFDHPVIRIYKRI